MLAAFSFIRLFDAGWFDHCEISAGVFRPGTAVPRHIAGIGLAYPPPNSTALRHLLTRCTDSAHCQYFLSISVMVITCTRNRH